jgi:hypothetical protein
MPRVLPGPAAELNATQEKRENEKNRENADANFTSPRRKYCTAQERLRDHSPKKDETRFDNFQQFVFETVLRLIALRLTDSRMTAAKALPKSQVPAFDYGVKVWTALLVPFTTLCATFLAVVAVLFATFLAVRTGPAWTLPTQTPSARNSEYNAFMVLKYRSGHDKCVCLRCHLAT